MDLNALSNGKYMLGLMGIQPTQISCSQSSVKTVPPSKSGLSLAFYSVSSSKYLKSLVIDCFIQSEQTPVKIKLPVPLGQHTPVLALSLLLLLVFVVLHQPWSLLQFACSSCSPQHDCSIVVLNSWRGFCSAFPPNVNLLLAKCHLQEV